MTDEDRDEARASFQRVNFERLLWPVPACRHAEAMEILEKCASVVVDDRQVEFGDGGLRFVGDDLERRLQSFGLISVSGIRSLVVNGHLPVGDLAEVLRRLGDKVEAVHDVVAQTMKTAEDTAKRALASSVGGQHATSGWVGNNMSGAITFGMSGSTRFADTSGVSFGMIPQVPYATVSRTFFPVDR